MANTKPRRGASQANPRVQINKRDKAPWNKGDPTKKIGLNTPIPEPLMLQLDWLIENRVIFSKASFIREVVSRAAEDEIKRALRVREAVRKMDKPT